MIRGGLNTQYYILLHKRRHRGYSKAAVVLACTYKVPGSFRPPYIVVLLLMAQDGCVSSSHHTQVSERRMEEGEKKGYDVLL